MTGVQTCALTISQMNLNSIFYPIYSIEDYNIKLIASLTDAANIFEKASRSYKCIAEVYGATGISELFEVFQSLGDTIEKIGDSFDKLKDALRLDLNLAFNYHTKELEAVNELIKGCNKDLSIYRENEIKLNLQKENLLVEQKIDDWNMKSDSVYQIDIMKTDKDFALKNMLPNETKKLDKLV